MALNKSKGNMYGFVTHTFNMIKGKCSHDCVYCYMRQFKLNPVRLDKAELKTDLGQGNFIFVGSSTDMWADDIQVEWIEATLNHCVKYPKNRYLFQSKNPRRFLAKDFAFPNDTIFGTTIETNRNRYLNLSNASPIKDRIGVMNALKFVHLKTMITIEPIMDFDLGPFSDMIIGARPDWVNIGADSKGHNLPEPSEEKVLQLISEIEKFTKVIQKKNLKRLASPRRGGKE